MVSKCIMIPLLVMLCVGFFNMLILRDVSGFAKEISSSAVFGSAVFEDTTHHHVCYGNGTAIGEVGEFTIQDRPDVASMFFGDGSPAVGYVWVNSSTFMGMGLKALEWELHTDDAQYKDENLSLNWWAGGSLGMLGIFAGLMVLATLVGVRVLGIGISEMSISTLVKGLAYLSIFLLCGSMSINRIMSFPVFGWFIFFGLTAVYTLGMIGQMGHVGGSD